MIEIIIKTNSDIYNSGDILFGAVYLKVDDPTSGCGIKVTIKGLEQYVYHDVGRLTTPRERLSDGCVVRGSHILMDEQLILCLFEGPIPMQHFVFPFKTHIPSHMPGSFCQRSWCGPKWTAEITYQVTAEVIGAEQFQTTYPIHINHVIGDPSVPLEVNTSKKVTANKFLRGMKKDFSFSVSLDKTAYFIGDAMKLSMIFHSQTSCIKEINIKLQRDISFTQMKCSPRSPTRQFGFPLDDGDAFQDLTIHPEIRTTVWQSAPLFTKALLGSMLPAVYIPLDADAQGHGIQPTTDGYLINCKYTIILSIELAAGDNIETEILVPCISVKRTPRCTSETDNNPWMNSCKVVFPMDFNPEEEWKGWSVYADAGFPTLSLMRSPSLRHRNRRRGNRNSKNEIVSGEFDLTMDDLKCAD